MRPRYARLAAAGTALVITALALLGGVGVLPGTSRDSVASVARGTVDAGTQTGETAYAATSSAAAPSTSTPAPASTPAATASSNVASTPAAPTPVPADSGQGRRIVFSESQQRVWLIGTKGAVARTYLVSGSTLPNLDPGSYQVYSRSRWAVGIDDSGVMQYFVRFTQGPTGAAIGFHSIPAKQGHPLQTRAQLGTPRSHGCIRQAKADAIALWEFAPLKTHVDVVA